MYSLVWSFGWDLAYFDGIFGGFFLLLITVRLLVVDISLSSSCDCCIDEYADFGRERFGFSMQKEGFLSFIISLSIFFVSTLFLDTVDVSSGSAYIGNDGCEAFRARFVRYGVSWESFSRCRFIGKAVGGKPEVEVRRGALVDRNWRLFGL